MRLFVIFFSAILLFADTNKNIQDNQQRLQNISNQKDSINAKLKTLGNNINDKNVKIKELDKQILTIEKNIDINQKLYLEQEKVYTESDAKLKELSIHQERLRQDLIDTILKDMTIVIMLNSKEPLNEDSIMSEEILKQLSVSTKNRIKQITDEQKDIAKNMKEAELKIDAAKKVITSQREKKEVLESTRKEQLNLTKNLKVELDSYNNELKRLDNERVEIQKILADLNILRQQELKKQNASNNANKAQSGNTAPIEVRQIGSSYHNVSTAKYSGAKTIAPLKEYVLETKYGPYFDPVYKMRIFNEFITFSVKRKSDVLAVLAGKVVFAKDTAMLKKIVIIEHSNGLHTIYSNLDDIKASIKVGANVKKGDIIAFVNDKLNFEVTQKDKHINPLDLITVK